MKSTIAFALFTLFSIIFLDSCFIYRAVHVETADVGFFKNKNEGNVTINYDGNDVSGKIGAQFSYSVGDNFLIGAGGSAHNDGLQEVLFPLRDSRNNEYKLSGVNGKFFAGYFNNFGSDLKGYTETILTVSGGSEKMTIFSRSFNGLTEEYRYNPLGIALQTGLGVNTDNAGFLGGIKFNFYNYNEALPVDYFISNPDLHSQIFYTQIFAAGRFGKGPVKANIQLSIVHNIYPWYDNDDPEIFPVFGFGITYNWGRKNPKILSL